MRELEAQIICVDRYFVLCGGRWAVASKTRKHVASQKRRIPGYWSQQGELLWLRACSECCVPVTISESSGIRFAPQRPSGPTFDRLHQPINLKGERLATTSHICDTALATMQQLPEELLSADGVFKMSTFLTYSPRFKDDIILIMDTSAKPDFTINHYIGLCSIIAS